MAKFTEKQRQSLYQQIVTLKDQGHGTTEACNEVGVDPKNYYNWSRKYKDDIVPQTIEIPDEPKASGMFVVFGNPGELAEFASKYHG